MDTPTMILICGLFTLMFVIQVVAIIYQIKENKEIQTSFDVHRERMSYIEGRNNALAGYIQDLNNTKNVEVRQLARLLGYHWENEKTQPGGYKKLYDT